MTIAFQIKQGYCLDELIEVVSASTRPEQTQARKCPIIEGRGKHAILSTAKEPLTMGICWEIVFFKDVAPGRLTTFQSITKHPKVHGHNADLKG